MTQEKVKVVKVSRKIYHFPWIGFILPSLILLLWWTGTSTGFINPLFLSTPVDVAKTMVDMLLSGILISDFWDSIRRMLLGTFIGFMSGLVFGSLTGYFRLAQKVLDPTIQAFRSIPGIAYIPILIMAFGIDDAPKIVLIAIIIFFPTYVNAFAGVRSTDQKLIELARAYRLCKRTVLTRIIFPSALPQIFISLRLAAALAWIAAVLSEIMAGNSGLGLLLNEGRIFGRPDQTIAMMLVLGIAGKCTDSLVCALGRWCTRWQTTFEGE